MRPIIDVQGVEFSYPDGTFALKGISFRIWKGEKVAIVGPNGAGKTTLLLHLNGLLIPKLGKITIKELEVSEKNLKEIRKLVGFVFQNSDDQLFMPTVVEDIAFGPLNLGLRKEEALQKVDFIVKFLELEEIKDKMPHHLSEGQKKRVALAGVLAMDPDVIILDEPTANLDYEGQEKLLSILNQLQGKGITAILATHDVDLAAEWAEKIVILYNGQVIANGTKEVLFNPKILERAKLRLPRN